MVLELEHVSYAYDPGTVFTTHALNDVSLKIEKGQFLGLAGHTGSGKSTLIQMLNGLLKPDSGRVLFEGTDIREKNFSKKELRKKVGLIFQYPEYQLFEETVIKDVCFGPKNLGKTDEEAYSDARDALLKTGIEEKFFEASPFELSGGQKRRVAIAGVLAMNPEVLILDEPTAGLDPSGSREILERIEDIHKNTSNTVILVSHDMNALLRHTDRMIVMKNGEVFIDKPTNEICEEPDKLESAGLLLPELTMLLIYLKKRGLHVNTGIINAKEAADEIKNAILRGLS